MIVLLALAVAGARLAFANPPEAGTPPDDAERIDARTFAELRAENERLLRELATLRQTVTRTALPDDVGGSKGSDSTDAQQPDGKPEGFAVSKLDLEILELELREQVQLGILAKHFESIPEEFLWFVADVWISADHPERAYRLCCQLRDVVAPPELLLSIGMSLGEVGDPSMAVEVYARVLTQVPHDYEALMELARRDPVAGLAALEAARLSGVADGETTSTLDSFRVRLLAAKGDLSCKAQIQAMMTGGPLDRDSEGFDQSIWNDLLDLNPALLREVLEERASDTATASTHRDDAMLLALARARTGERELAIRALRELAIVGGTPDFEAITALAELDAVAGLEFLRDAVRIDPSDEMLWAYAQGLRGAGRHDEAVAVSEQLWQQTPNRSNSAALLDAHPEIWIDRITLQARSGNVREPDEVLGGVGIKLLELGRIDEAITLLREAARIDPDDGEWQSRLRDTYAALRSR